MASSSHLFSMFHRRLMLLMGIILLSMAVLGGQIARLTVVQGQELREEAESRLVTRQWIPTTRGRILDRKNRVLAQDRPSFDVNVDFQVITGEWAVRVAGARARRDYGERWRSMSPEERQPILDLYIAAYQGHLDRMWSLIAEIGRETEERLAERRQEIIRRVESMKASIYAARLARELEARLDRGESISVEVDDQTHRRLSRPIEDQQAPHTILGRVPDEVGFAFMRLENETTDLEVPSPNGGSALVRVPLLPGLTVEPSGDRDYPFDTVSVDVDLSTLPPPIRQDGRKVITVEGVAYHILGRMKDRAHREDSERRAARRRSDPEFAARVETPPGLLGPSVRLDRGQYQGDDPAGLSGLELAREDDLRGLRGLKIEQLETGERRELPPVPGRDVQLTIDVALQARVQAAMSPELGLAVAQQWHYADGATVNPTTPIGTPLNGAAVVIEVDSGDILAMVSTPSIPRRLLEQSPEAIFADPLNLQADMPWIDRSIGRPYPPGSIAKALILSGAVKFGRLNLDSGIPCTGHLFPDQPQMYRCWIYKQFHFTHSDTFGALNAEQALMVSCNIYFFTLGQRLGGQGVIDTYRMFGLGRPLNLFGRPDGSSGDEFLGFLGFAPSSSAIPPPASAATPGRVSIQDAIQMGIGQGPVAWTPLHAADAYATLARGGVRIPPHLINEPSSLETEDLGLDPRAVREALAGLWASVNDSRGTGHHLGIEGRPVHFNVPGVAVWGKTGTATAPRIDIKATIQDPKTGKPIPNPLWDRAVDRSVITGSDGSELPIASDSRVLRWGDHSWFVVLAGHASDRRPLYAVAVMMEYAGSGGKVSGPIVNQILHALRAEGYL